MVSVRDNFEKLWYGSNFSWKFEKKHLSASEEVRGQKLSKKFE